MFHDSSQVLWTVPVEDGVSRQYLRVCKTDTCLEVDTPTAKRLGWRVSLTSIRIHHLQIVHLAAHKDRSERAYETDQSNHPRQQHQECWTEHTDQR